MRIFLLLLFTSLCEGHTILVYNPSLGTSHSIFMNKLSDILIDAGHRVVQLQPISNRNINIGTTKAEEIRVDFEFTKNAAQYDDESSVEKMWTHGSTDPLILLKVLQMFNPVFRQSCTEMLNNEELLDKLRSYKFDIAFTEPADMCGYGIFKKVGIPQHITSISLYLQDRIAQIAGVPIAPSYVPGLSSNFGAEMTFGQRLYNVYIWAINALTYDLSWENVQNVFDEKYGDESPDLKELLADSTFIFTNTDPIFDYPHPTLHKVIDIGGISVPPKSVRTLDKAWDDLLNLRKRNVLISFGSISKSSCMPQKWKENIQKVLRNFPDVTFIWKYEKPEHKAGVSPEEAVNSENNIVTVKWMPQPELLSDERVTGFVTHGGIGSIMESTLRGVPMLVIPVMWDQYRNAKMSERTGNGMSFVKEDLGDENKLHEAIKRFLDDESLRSNASRLAGMVENRPFSMEETLVKYTEFAIEQGPFPQLNPHGRHLSYVQYFLLDIIATVLIVLSTVIAFVVWIIRRLLWKKVKTD